MAINSGVNIAKSVSFAVLDNPLGVDIAKAVAFAVLDTVYAPAWPGVGFSNGSPSVPYSSSIDLSPATPTVSVSVTSGSLPTGLSLGISGDVVTISGTPTVAGSFPFDLTASNSYGSASKSFTIAISALTGEVSYTYA